MILLKQSTAADVVIGPFVNDTDGKTPEVGLAISQADCQLTKNAGAVAQKNDATAASHLGGGHYKVPLNTTDTNTLGRLRLYVNESGALPVWLDFMVMPANVWDSLFGADALQVHAVEMSAGLITAAAIATDAIDADALAANAVTEIQSGLATAAALATVDDFLDTEIAAILAAVDTEVAAIKAKTDNLPASPAAVGSAMTLAADAVNASALAANAIDEIWDEAMEGSETARQQMRLMRAAAVGESGGGGTGTVTFRDAADSKNRVSATVDEDGNRTAVTVDAT